MTEETLLMVEHLKTYFQTDRGLVKAVDDVGFKISKGEALGLIGETGCGKTVTALSIIGLLGPQGRVHGGSVLFENKDLLKLSNEELRSVRGTQISMIFQEPTSALDPISRVGDQIVELLQLHLRMDRKTAREKAIQMLRFVGINSPETIVRSYPFELSTGMAQRVMIAMALSCNPKLLIADEPTSSLDVTTQAQILDLVADLRRTSKLSILLITHDLAVASELCERVAVMYAGKVVEIATTNTVLTRSRHPYTAMLLRAIPVTGEGDYLENIAGDVPNMLSMPTGCRFHPRCPFADQKCREDEPQLRELESGHKVACHYSERIWS